ncbi:MAG: GNAT family N-acetyltransferase [Bacteroidota bacterium]
MNISSLQAASIQDIVSCLLEAFKDYFVPMPSDIDYWEARYRHARVNYEQSWGVFEDGSLKGFVVNGLGESLGIPTAFNTGTGIVETHRGRQLVDRMYAAGIPGLIEQGIRQCKLEVIDQNKRAIRVYERIGFQLGQQLKCYKGEVISKRKTKCLDRTIEQLPTTQFDPTYSWDHQTPALLLAKDVYRAVEVLGPADTLEGYIIINPRNGNIAQLETNTGNWEAIFDGIGQLANEVRIINIPEKRTELISYLTHQGFNNTINQYDMHMPLQD